MPAQPPPPHYPRLLCTCPASSLPISLVLTPPQGLGSHCQGCPSPFTVPFLKGTLALAFVPDGPHSYSVTPSTDPHRGGIILGQHPGVWERLCGLRALSVGSWKPPWMGTQSCLTSRPALITLLACSSLGPQPGCAGSADQRAARGTCMRPGRLQALIYLQWRGDKSRALWERPQLYSEALVTGLIDGGAQMQTQQSEFPDF